MTNTIQVAPPTHYSILRTIRQFAHESLYFEIIGTCSRVRAADASIVCIDKKVVQRLQTEPNRVHTHNHSAYNRSEYIGDVVVHCLSLEMNSSNRL